MKRKTAKELLADSFLELAETEPVAKIKIKDITANCGYSPATFYRQYKDKTDLLLWTYSRDFEEVVQNAVSSGKTTLESMILSIILYFRDNREYYSGIIKSEKGSELFVIPITNLHFEMVKEYYIKHSKIKLEIEEEMVLRTFVVGVIEVIFEWLTGMWDVTPQELSKICVKALPNCFSEYEF
ncbi:MAG: TetR/AcrR family transcriptional regulator [Sphaerochaetaceae bacterium]|nr:TetR/AcrR family transcriptional regulator [Sphaerochaetaceae bacterium]